MGDCSEPLRRLDEGPVTPFLDVYRDALIWMSKTEVLSACIYDVLIASSGVLLAPTKLIVFLLLIFAALGPLMPFLAVAGAAVAVVRGGIPRTLGRFLGTVMGILGAAAFAAGVVPASVALLRGRGADVSGLELCFPFLCCYLGAAGFVTQLFDLCVQLAVTEQLSDSVHESGDLQYGQDRMGRLQFDDRMVLLRTLASSFRIDSSHGPDELFDSWLMRALPQLIEDFSREGDQARRESDEGECPKIFVSHSSRLFDHAIDSVYSYEFRATVEMFFIGKLGFWQVLATVLTAASQAALPSLWRRSVLPASEDRLAAAIAAGYMLVSFIAVFMLLAYANGCLTLFRKLKHRALVILYLSATEQYRRFLRRAYRPELHRMVFVPLPEEDAGGACGEAHGAADKAATASRRHASAHEERPLLGGARQLQRQEPEAAAGEGGGCGREGGEGGEGGGAGATLRLLEMDGPLAGGASRAALTAFALRLRRPRLASCGAAAAPAAGTLGERLRQAFPGSLPVYTLDVGKFLFLRKILRLFAVVERFRAQNAVICLLLLIIVSVVTGCAGLVHRKAATVSSAACLFDSAVFTVIITALINHAIQLNLIMREVTEEMLMAWQDRIERMRWVAQGACEGVSQDHVLVDAYFRSTRAPLEYAVEHIEKTEMPVGFFGVPLTGRLRNQLLLSIAGSLLFFGQKVVMKLDWVEENLPGLHYSEHAS